jgi:hypothetical protein
VTEPPSGPPPPVSVELRGGARLDLRALGEDWAALESNGYGGFERQLAWLAGVGRIRLRRPPRRGALGRR